MRVAHLLIALAASALARPGYYYGGKRRGSDDEIKDDNDIWDDLFAPGDPCDDEPASAPESLDQALHSLSQATLEISSMIKDYEPLESLTDQTGQHILPPAEAGADTDEARQKRTVYHVICGNEMYQEFCKLVTDHKDIRKKLEDLEREHTVFVPTDDAFREFPGHDRPKEEMIHRMIQYHVVPEVYSLSRIMTVQTIPTSLREADLGRRPQRLRVSVGLTGIHLNFDARISASNIDAANGVLHAVERVLVPPPKEGRVIESLPEDLEYFALRMEKSGLGRELRRAPHEGGTLFAPSDGAWGKLREETRGFLTSDEGKGYLRALLKYHFVTNETLYSDAHYEARNRSPGPHFPWPSDYDAYKSPIHRHHVSLEPLLPNRTIEVDISSWMGLTRMSVNGGKARVSLHDGVARDGVVHVVDSVLVPPKHGGQRGHEDDKDFDSDRVTVKELKERLRRFVEDDDEAKGDGPDGPEEDGESGGEL